jgi:sugar lactone lactonase YvrE
MIWRRGLVSFVAVVIAITAPVVAASAATAPAEGSANDAHTADVRLPGSVALPVNFAPEGIAKGEGSTFYAASLATGDIYRGNLRSGQGEILVNAPAGEEAVGLKADEADRLLFVCGGTTGAAHVYNSRTGALVAQYQLAPDGTSLINYAVLTAHGAYFTDSYNPDIYEIPIGPFGRLGRAVTIPLNGPVAAFSKNGLNLNGIAATADGKTLIVDNTVLDKLFTVDPITGASAAINVAGLIPDSMDGMLLQGSSLWVVENTANTVIRVTLSHELSRGTITSTITSPLFDDPTTVAKYGNELALPNGRYNLGLPPPFGLGAPPGTTFNVVVVPAPGV